MVTGGSGQMLFGGVAEEHLQINEDTLWGGGLHDYTNPERFPVRLGHAFVFSFVDRTDGGHTTIAISNFTGAAAGGFIGNACLPAGFDNLTHAGQRSAIAFGGIAAQNVFEEFSPELGHFLKKIHVRHIPMPPVWWTGDK